MKRTGEILKKSREEKKLSLHEVALFLKINSRVLQAIEDGDTSQLPARTFLRGFIQSYAKFLKLDPQFVLQVFAEESAPPASETKLELITPVELEKREPIQEKPLPAEEKKTPEDRSEVDVINLEKSILSQSQVAQDKLGFKTIAISVLGLLLVVILYLANGVIKKYQKESVVEPVESIASVETQEAAAIESAEEPLPVNAATPLPVDEKTPVPTKPVEPVSSPLVSSPVIAPVSPVVPAPSAAGSTVVPSPVTALKTPPVEKVEMKPPEKSAAQKPETTLAPAIAPTALTKPAEKKEEGKLIEVIVEATDTVEIEYSSAKTSPQKMALKADQIHTFKSRSGVRLKISNGGAVNIIMNGRDLGAPGAAGQPIQVAY